MKSITFFLDSWPPFDSPDDQKWRETPGQKTPYLITDQEVFDKALPTLDQRSAGILPAVARASHPRFSFPLCNI